MKYINTADFDYIMNKYNGERQIGRPSGGYFETCLRGYRDCGLDARYLQEALQKSITRMPNMMKYSRRHSPVWIYRRSQSTTNSFRRC